MTTIAVDKDKKTGRLVIAADSLRTFNRTQTEAPESKIFKYRTPDSSVVYTIGCSGDTGAIVLFKTLMLESSKISRSTLPHRLILGFAYNIQDWENFNAIAINNYSQRLYVYDKYLMPYEMFVPFAIGAGAEFAIGAMHACADPRKAVEIANKVCYLSGGTRIDSYKT